MDELLAIIDSMAAVLGRPISVLVNIKSDNAGEFLSREFWKMLTDKGIHQTTCPPHIHQLNGVAERAIYSLMEQVRVNLVASNLPVSFWAYAAIHATDVVNRTAGLPAG